MFFIQKHLDSVFSLEKLYDYIYNSIRHHPTFQPLINADFLFIFPVRPIRKKAELIRIAEVAK